MKSKFKLRGIFNKMNKQEAQISYTRVEKEYFKKLWNKVTDEIKSQTTRPKKGIKNGTN